MIKAIIFDCFGVLITDPLLIIVVELRIAEPEKADRIVALLHSVNMGKLDTQTFWLALAETLGLSLEDCKHSVTQGESKNEQLLQRIEILGQTYKIGLLSNVMAGGLTSRFSREELQLFDAVVASGDTGFSKPDAQAYEYIAELLDVRLDECVMIDDREDYCDGARRVGMRALRYESFEQLQQALPPVLV